MNFRNFMSNGNRLEILVKLGGQQDFKTYNIRLLLDFPNAVFCKIKTSNLSSIFHNSQTRIMTRLIRTKEKKNIEDKQCCLLVQQISVKIHNILQVCPRRFSKKQLSFTHLKSLKNLIRQ